MIGLGSNRLSVCRRGGMSVTQAGRGGMEWLAGGRRPRWASPYSAQATAALKAQFPTQWPTIRDYGFAHPEIVPYVNANPLCAAIWCCYVQDGLVFQMDCNYECTAAKWKDVRSAIEFIGTNVQIVDGVPYFNGAAYYKGPEQNHLFASYTLEVVYKGRNTNTSLIFMENGTSGASRVSMGILSASELLADSGSTGHPSIRHSAHTSLTTVGVAGDSIACVNGESASRGGSNNWSHNGVNNCFIGARYEGGQCFNGDIIAIRIYNRLLTEQEILANQAIDLQRWQTS